MLEETVTNYCRQKLMAANKQGFNLVQYTWINSLKTLFNRFFCDMPNKQLQCCLFFVSSTYFFFLEQQTVAGELGIQ